MRRSTLLSAVTTAFALFSGTWAAPGITDALLVDQQGQPDPCVYFDNATSTYYCYSDHGRLITSSHINSGWKSHANYSILASNGDPWEKDIGAPSVGFLNDKYVMYFSSEQKILVATSASPVGPFKLESEPLLKPASQPGTKAGKIAFPAAPALFQHEGKNYMLYKYGRAADFDNVSAMCIREISANGLTATGDPAELFTVTKGKQQDGRQFTEDEGPNMVYHDGTFYLFFNAGTWCAPTYQIVYATSKMLMPSKPYTYGGVLLETSGPKYDGVTLTSPGGISFVDPTTFIFMSYQPDAHPSCKASTKPSRYIHAGQLQYQPNGSVSIAPTWTD